MAIATTTIIALAVVAIAAATSGYAASTSMAAQRDAANYNAAVQKNQAAAATQQSQFDAQRIRDRNARILASQQAGYSKAGVDISSGTAQDVYYDSAINGELDALAALYTGRVSANNSISRAGLYGMEADNANRGRTMGVIGSVLGGASSGATVISSDVNSRRTGV